MYWIKESVALRDPEHQDESRYRFPVIHGEGAGADSPDVKEGRLGNLLPPHEVYRAFFTPPPDSASVKSEEGRLYRPAGRRDGVRIPGAFADWPPDDNQPPWGDVTYLRMYTHPDFNYIGYNTIRMYDTRLTQAEYVNRPSGTGCIGIIPYYQSEFGIDGVMIDMGHALPMQLKAEIVAAARKKTPISRSGMRISPSRRKAGRRI